MNTLLWVIIYASISMNVLLFFVAARLSRDIEKTGVAIADIERQISKLNEL